MVRHFVSSHLTSCYVTSGHLTSGHFYSRFSFPTADWFMTTSGLPCWSLISCWISTPGLLSRPLIGLRLHPVYLVGCRRSLDFRSFLPWFSFSIVDWFMNTSGLPCWSLIGCRRSLHRKLFPAVLFWYAQLATVLFRSRYFRFRSRKFIHSFVCVVTSRD